MRALATSHGLLVATVALVAARVSAQQPAPQAEDSFPGVAQQVSVGQQIEEIQSSQGISSPDLIGPLTNLGLILREQGDLDLAVAAFERARHVVRVNYGLSSFKEAPLLRQLVQIEEAKGNAAAAWDLEQELIGLLRGSPGPGAAPMLREIADKRVDVLERYSAGEFPPQIELGCYYTEPARRNYAELDLKGNGSCRSGSSYRVKAALLDEARSYYVDTIQMVLLSEGPSAAELPEFYMGWVRAIYAAANDFTTEYDGRGILRDLHSLAVKNSEPLPVQMNALVRIADWDLLFAGGRKKNEAALQAYEALYGRLEQEGLAQSLIDEMFSPSVPVVLPSFSPNRLASIETPDSQGFIDAAFEITKYGEGKSIEILDTSTNTTEAARARLREIIKWGRFRPRVANGAFEDPSRVVVRYYVSD